MKSRIKQISQFTIALDNILEFTSNPESFLVAWGMTEAEFQECVKYGVEFESFDLEDIARISVLGKLYNFDLIAKDMYDVVLNTAYTAKQRSIALASIWFRDGTQSLYDSLSIDDKIKLCSPWLYPVIKTSKTGEFPRVALSQLLSSTPIESLQGLILVMEEIRTFCKVEPTYVYSSYINGMITKEMFDIVLVSTGLTPIDLGYKVSNGSTPLFDENCAYTRMYTNVQ